MRCALACALSLLFGFASDAAEITFMFTGTVTEVRDDVVDPDVSFPGGLPEIGTAFTVQYSFDPETPDDSPDSDLGEYAAVSELRLFFESTGVAFVVTPWTGNGRIQIQTQFTFAPDPPIGNSYNASVPVWPLSGSSTPSFADPTWDYAVVGVTLIDEDFAAFPTDALPVNLPPLSSFEYNDFLVASYYQNEIMGVLGKLDSFTAIPEPTVCGQLLSGAVALLALAGRKRRALPQ